MELTLINNDGNIIDAVNYATIIALSRYKKPFVGIEGGCIRVYDATEKAPQFLSNFFLPKDNRFAFFADYADFRDSERGKTGRQG